MKHSKLYTYLGIAGALLVPAFAVAAVEIPNVFEGGDPVSASQMNENFAAMAEAIEALEEKVEALENAGLQPPVVLENFLGPLEDLVVIYQVHTDGIFTARPVGKGFTSTTVGLDIAPDVEAMATCLENCTRTLGRGHDGSSGAVVVPAGYYVALNVGELDETAQLGVFWQPLHGPDPSGKAPTLIKSSHP